MRNNARSWLLATLSERTIDRIMVDLGCGVGIAAVGKMIRNGVSIFTLDGVLTIIFGGLFITLSCIVVIGLLLGFLVAGLRRPSPVQWLQAATSEWSQDRGWELMTAVVLTVVYAAPALGVVWGIWAGPSTVWVGATDAFIAVLPAVLVLVFIIWACLLTQRRLHACQFRWARYAPDVLIIVLTGLEFLVLFDRDLLATQPAAGPLFPVGIWFSIQTWLMMVGSRRLGVRAGADIVLSLLLGANFVLFLVWAANLLDLPNAEVAILRGTLERVGSIADLPWWLWAGLYILLAGSSLAFALWPEGLKAIARWFQRLRVVPSINVGRRVLTGVHISLLVTVLIGLTAPAALEAALRDPLKAKYTVALQREWELTGELAAYQEIRRRFTDGTSTSPSVQPLSTIISKIHDISSPPSGDSDATNTERDIAGRLGQVQATTLQLTATQSVLSVPQTVTDLAHFDLPIRDDGDLNDRLGHLDTQQDRVETVALQVQQAADLAASAIANVIQIPGLGEHEVVQILREYLSGLVEGSPLKDVFAAWVGRLTHATSPPRTDEMVVPDPEELQKAALAALAKEQARVQVDPSIPDQVQTRTLTESSAEAAVDVVNEVRYLDEDTGPCNGCPRPLSPGNEHDQGPDHHRVGPANPGEPVRPPVEPPRVVIPIR